MAPEHTVPDRDSMTPAEAVVVGAILDEADLNTRGNRQAVEMVTDVVFNRLGGVIHWQRIAQLAAKVLL